jgi:hypothetical protein
MAVEHRLIDNVDSQIDHEMEVGGAPFFLLARLKRANSQAWVSPEMSLRMLVYVERRALGTTDDNGEED